MVEREPNLAVIVAGVFEKLFQRLWPTFGKVEVIKAGKDQLNPSWIILNCRVFRTEIVRLFITEESIAVEESDDPDSTGWQYGGNADQIINVPLMDPKVWEKITLQALKSARGARERAKKMWEYYADWDLNIGFGDPFYQSRSIVHKDEI